ITGVAKTVTRQAVPKAKHATTSAKGAAAATTTTAAAATMAVSTAKAMNSRISTPTLVQKPKVVLKSKTGSGKGKGAKSFEEKTKSRVRPINKRKPINSEYANKVYPLEKLPQKLRENTPTAFPLQALDIPIFLAMLLKKWKLK